MLERFYPKEYREDITVIDYDSLRQKGIIALVFDIDNTIAPFDVAEPDNGIIDFFAGLAGKGFKVCLLSNNKKERVLLFNQKLKLHAIHRAGKPWKRGLRRALTLLEAGPGQAAIIGDQIFTDVWCGNRMGIYTVLVQPIAQRDEWTVKLKRGLEKLVVDHYMKKAGAKP